MTLVGKRWLLYVGWGFCILSSNYFSLNIAITVISFLGERKFTVYLVKVRFAYYFKFGGAIKYVSSLHSKPLSMIIAVPVKSIKKYGIIRHWKGLYVFIFSGLTSFY